MGVRTKTMVKEIMVFCPENCFRGADTAGPGTPLCHPMVRAVVLIPGHTLELLESFREVLMSRRVGPKHCSKALQMIPLGGPRRRSPAVLEK